MIQTTISLVDKMTAPINNIISALNNVCSTFDKMENSSSNAFDMSSVNQAKGQLAAAAEQMREVSGATDNASSANHRLASSASSGSGAIGSLTNKVVGLVSAYAGIQGIKSVLGVSDELVSTQARLDQMNSQLGGTDLQMSNIYTAAQNARGSLSDMASVVARFGNNAKDAFSSSDEVLKFASIVQKQMTIAGASTQEAANAELQLSQALGSGVLRGDELNSIFEQAPNLIQSIADYMDAPIGQIRSMAADGKLSADVVKQAVLASADEVDAKFNAMPMTWSQVAQSIKNTATMAFQPVLNKVNELANSQGFQTFVNNAMGTLANLANFVLGIADTTANIASWVSENWSVIKPVVLGIVAALGLYAAAMLVINTVNTVAGIIEGVKAASQAMATGATLAETAAQYGLNSALLACPLTWIILMIIAIIAAIFAVSSAIASMTGVAQSGFGVICGGINVVIQFFRNLGLSVANIALGIWNALNAVAQNIVIAFQNAIGKVQAFFYNLASTAATVVSNIANALNKLPFVNIDTSGITSAASSFKARAEAAGTSQSYKSVSAAFSSGMSTNKTFAKGWASSAFKSGASFGDGVSSKVSSAFSSKSLSSLGSKSFGLANNAKSGSGNLANNAAKTAGNTGKTAGNTSKIAKTLNTSKTDLELLRKLAETKAVNRFTTASIKVQMTNNNKVSSAMDLDGMVDYLTTGVQQAMQAAAEGAY